MVNLKNVITFFTISEKLLLFRKKQLFLAALLLLLIVGGNIYLIATHENAHMQIYRNYGVTSEIKYSLNPARFAVTQPLSSVSMEDRLFINGLQVLNEIMGYQIIAVYNLLTATMIFITLLFFVKKET